MANLLAENQEQKDQDSQEEVIISPENHIDHNQMMPGTDPVAEPKNKHGFWKVPDTETYVQVLGIIKATAATDISGGDSYPESNYLYANNINVPTKNGHNFRLCARESVFHFQALMPFFDKQKISAHIETDFMGGENTSKDTESCGYDARIRKAYVHAGNFLVGQTWSGFVDIDSFPETITAGPVGLPQLRQTLIGYEQRHKLDVGKLFIRATIENARSEAKINPQEAAVTAKTANQSPDVILGAGIDDENYKVFLRGVLRRNCVTYNTNTHRKSGYGLALSGFYKIPEIKDKISFSVAYGSGIGRYFHDSAGQATYFDERTCLFVNNKTTAGSIGYQHFFGTKYNLRSVISCAFMRMGNNEKFVDSTMASGDKNKQVHSFQINMLGLVAEKFTVGIEFMHAKRKLENNTSGKLNRLLAMVRFSF
ncbi:MAG: hypothetical protein LBC04_00415 [Holosporaceae bacterium]|jgi:hypothetical protein|nr:hypothetical protein [Holosporaceae bacterium]